MHKDWTDRAACKDADTEIFYSTHPRLIADAQEICSTCPVQQTCQQWGIEHEEFGVWGGLSEQERKWIRKQHGIRLQAMHTNHAGRPRKVAI